MSQYYYKGKKYGRATLVLTVVKDYATHNDEQSLLSRFGAIKPNRPTVKMRDAHGDNVGYFAGNDNVVACGGA